MNRIIQYLFLSSCLAMTITANGQHTDTITVHFDLDRSSLSPEADSILNKLAPAINTNQSLTITGYCDNTGSETHNNQLSLARARTVSEYLARHGLDSTAQINCTGVGTRDPINDNSTPAKRALNRRVTIVIHRPAPPATATTTSPPSPAPKPDTISRPANHSIYKAITDTTTRIGSTVILKDVVFIGGRHIPLGISYIALDELLKAMTDNQNLRIRIEGHVCCIPDKGDGLDVDTGTWDLSLQRAKFIYEYLVKHGISPDRMSYTGLGGANKIYPEEYNAAQQTLNRRVEIRIIAK